ncbi:hypothetical protein [Aliihoeflea sp. 40Bstr573]|uniref:hypothetical protein n=1 Tax=Aliihoeflea sp. 40Bstr573 TaxID=2696467 RepID=UPI0020951B9A|nr:hypothetical protein [Aliihoeflea sp. 40Bstr573]MCO6388633.1 hypothetical protein [Aliihoeflea sp. 40Bstr573]
MKATIRTTSDDLVKSLRSLLHGLADDVASGYRGERGRRTGDEGTDHKRGT